MHVYRICNVMRKYCPCVQEFIICVLEYMQLGNVCFPRNSATVVEIPL